MLKRPRVGPEYKYSAGFSPTFEEEIAQLQANYQFEHPEAVIDFLDDHRRLAALLLEAVAPLRASFGHEPALKVRILDDEYELSLHAAVLWEGAGSSASECRDHFDASWWLDHMRQADGLLVFDYEYVE